MDSRRMSMDNFSSDQYSTYPRHLSIPSINHKIPNTFKITTQNYFIEEQRKHLRKGIDASQIKLLAAAKMRIKSDFPKKKQKQSELMLFPLQKETNYKAFPLRNNYRRSHKDFFMQKIEITHKIKDPSVWKSIAMIQSCELRKQVNSRKKKTLIDSSKTLKTPSVLISEKSKQLKFSLCPWQDRKNPDIQYHQIDLR